MSSAKRRRTNVMGALPGRNPGMRAMRAISRATLSVTFWTFSAGISSSISRLHVASVVSVIRILGKQTPTNLLSILSPIWVPEGAQERVAHQQQTQTPQQKLSIENPFARVNGLTE